MFFLYLDRLLIGYKRYLVPFVIIINLILSGVFGVSSILGIRNSYAIVGLAIKVNRFLIIGTRGYLVFILLNIIS
jgi:hypothetical protein